MKAQIFPIGKLLRFLKVKIIETDPEGQYPNLFDNATDMSPHRLPLPILYRAPLQDESVTNQIFDW